MEVADRQEIRLAFGQPGACSCTLAFGAVPVTTTVVGDAPVSAVLAGLDVTAQRSGAAMLDRRHDLELMKAQVAGMGGPIGRAGSAEDIGDLERGAHASAVGCDLSHLEYAELVERTDHGAYRAGRDLGVVGGVVQLRVSERPRVIMRILLSY